MQRTVTELSTFCDRGSRWLHSESQPNNQRCAYVFGSAVLKSVYRGQSSDCSVQCGKGVLRLDDSSDRGAGRKKLRHGSWSRAGVVDIDGSHSRCGHQLSQRHRSSEASRHVVPMVASQRDDGRNQDQESPYEGERSRHHDQSSAIKRNLEHDGTHELQDW